MTWPFDDSDLPLHDGVDVGGAQERSMAHSVGGYQGIRTVEELNPDGSLTRLRTRWGRPIFETDLVRASSTSQKYRGFVAKSSSRAVLFDPYTLTVLDANYTPALNTYSVQDFATSWNVPVSDTTDWYDVVMFDGQTIKVNAKAMPTLGIVANQAFQAIPYVINRNDASDQYGNAERNATEKRVFAVGRSDVQSWGGSGVIETLTPTDARTEDRAMTIGQRVDFSTDTAWLGQLFYPSGYAWDGPGEWYFTSAQVQMLLTSTYLVKVAGNSNVAMPSPVFGGAVASSGNIEVDVVLPPTEIAVYGIGENSVNTPYTSNAPNGGGGVNAYYTVIFPWSGTVSKPLAGKVSGGYSRTRYEGDESASEIQSGVALTYVAQNGKNWDVRSETSSVTTQTVEIAAASEFTNIGSVEMTGDATNLYWGQYYVTPPTGGLNAAPPGPYRGTPSKYILNIGIGGSSCTRTHEEQNGGASVSIPGGDKLVDLSFSRAKSYGPKAEYSPYAGYYAGFLANPYAYIGTSVGMGIYNITRLSCYSDPSTDITWIRRYHGVWYSGSATYWQPDEAVDTINTKFTDMRDNFRAQIMYDSENTSGDYGRTYYTAVINPSVNLDNSSLSWITKDYILYDETNGVYISVESSFVGVDTSATLDVILKVQTRHHTTTQILGQYNYTYSQLVNERQIGTTGKYAMPSPQIRAIFAPLYQEQGSFKGAHYVTEEEEGNGATPAHLFNFLLYLKSYGDLATVNDDNLGPAVHFVPCNLLEMLYAFVFSQEYGVALSGDRYPVTFTTRYNDMMSTLFTNAVRVSVRDGVQGNWSDSLGSDFAAISTVSLHRT